MAGFLSLKSQEGLQSRKLQIQNYKRLLCFKGFFMGAFTYPVFLTTANKCIHVYEGYRDFIIE